MKVLRLLEEINVLIRISQWLTNIRIYLQNPFDLCTNSSIFGFSFSLCCIIIHVKDCLNSLKLMKLHFMREELRIAFISIIYANNKIQ